MLKFTKAELLELLKLLKGSKYEQRVKKALDKKPISIASRKAKGREFQKKVCDIIAEHFNITIKDHFDDNGLIACRPMGLSGTDIIVRKIDFPYAIECKNQRSISLGDWWNQCMANTSEKEFPLLIIKSEHISEPLFITNEAGFFHTVLK